MRGLQTIILLLAISTIFGQDYQISKFSLPELSDPIGYDKQFIQDTEGAIWLFAPNTVGVDKYLRYDGSAWETIDGPCSYCYHDVQAGPDGVIYLAAGTEGLYAYQDGNWLQMLTEVCNAVFIDATGQLGVLTDIGIGKVVDNQFVQTNNDNLPDYVPSPKIVMEDNRIFFGNYHYCYDQGWTEIEFPSHPTLAFSCGTTDFARDTNNLLYFSKIFQYILDGSLAGGYVGIVHDIDALISPEPGFGVGEVFDIEIDHNNVLWAAGNQELKRVDGPNRQEWILTDLFSEPDIPRNSLFIDAHNNCWMFGVISREIVVLHLDDIILDGANIVGVPGNEDVGDGCSVSPLGIDYDNDGFLSEEDCQDWNPNANPAQEEIVYNGIDDDCDPDTWDDDLDQDGYPYILYGSVIDCDDGNADINPGQVEIPFNGIDDDCRPYTLDDDGDQDGYGVDDCDDTNPDINPGQVEIPYNGIDDDCDPETLDDDGDQDGYGIADDCDDTNPDISPSQVEIPFNGIDDDCDHETLDDDGDQDGYSIADDCDDANPSISPGQVEIPYNGIDDDCNTETLDNDGDQDGFVYADDCDDANPDINPDQVEILFNGLDDDCNPETLDDDGDQDGYGIADDCDDTNPDINPAAEEIPNNEIDEDCDGMDLLSSVHTIANTRINIYPNPTNDIIYVDLDGQFDYHIKLYHINGVLIKESTQSTSIDVQAISQGTYLIVVEDRNSDQRIVDMIMVKK